LADRFHKSLSEFLQIRGDAHPDVSDDVFPVQSEPAKRPIRCVLVRDDRRPRVVEVSLSNSAGQQAQLPLSRRYRHPVAESRATRDHPA
jgi:hypothetical protein